MNHKALIAVLSFSVLLGAGCAKTATSNTATPQQHVDGYSTDPQTNNSQTDSNTETHSMTFPGKLGPERIHNKQVTISTDKGDIVFELFDDTAPLAVSNFVALAESDFYDGVTFHRREEGFVIQGGDPLGNGTGGPDYTFEDELTDSYSYDRGIVAMANRGPNTNGSQFFIMLDDVPLPKKYTIFGRVLSGMDVVDQIRIGDKMNEVTVTSKE